MMHRSEVPSGMKRSTVFSWLKMLITLGFVVWFIIWGRDWFMFLFIPFGLWLGIFALLEFIEGKLKKREEKIT